MSLLFILLTVGLFSAFDVSASVPLPDNQSSYQTAFLYFLPDYEPKEQTEAEARGCAKLGYTYTYSNCASPRILKDKCPVGNAYKTCYCAGSPTCTGSAFSSNPYPSSTGASSSSCMNCAGSTLYSWSCSSSTCASYSLSSCPSNGYCFRCCDGYYKLNSCSSGYTIEGIGTSATCAKNETCFGSTTEETGLGYTCSSCTNLQGQTLYTCLCTEVCSLSSCPANGNCSTDCKGKVCLDSCKSGYSKSGNSCVSNHVHSYRCPSGYSSYGCTICCPPGYTTYGGDYSECLPESD